LPAAWFFGGVFLYRQADQGARTDAGRRLEQSGVGCAGIRDVDPVIGLACPTVADLPGALDAGGRVLRAPRMPLVALRLSMPSSLHVEGG
jgi:hypothetical protein